MASSAENQEIRHIHFSLDHLKADTLFELRAGLRRYTLMPHNAATRRAHAAHNVALAMLPPEGLDQVTHYVENVELPSRSTMLLRIVIPDCRDPEALPPLAGLALHIPRAARLAHRRSDSAEFQPRIVLFDALGIDQVSSGDWLNLSLDADDILTTLDTATSLIFHHPQLATVNPTTASAIINDHIHAPENVMKLSRFAAAIKSQGTDWSQITNSKDYKGNALTWPDGFTKHGQPVQTYELSPATLNAAAAPMAGPLSTSQDDPQLRNAAWSSQQGISTVRQDLTLSPADARLSRRPLAHAIGFGDASSDFTLNNLSPGYGLDVDDTSLVFTPDATVPGAGTVSINVKNSYLRSLWAYVRFYDPDGNPMGDWTSVGLVSPVNVVMGIPVSTDPTTLTFDWPAGASKATLSHGGLGTSNWDNDIVWHGIALTGIFNYAIPGMFLVVGAVLDSNAWFKAFTADAPATLDVIKAANSVCGTFASGSICFPNVKSILATFGSAIAGLLVHAALARVRTYVIEQMTEGGMEEAIPFANFFFAIANRAVDLAEMAETTVQVLQSPAVYALDINRSMPLNVSVSPDPTHGGDGNPAIWPLTSDNFQCVISYKGGTSYTTAGPMLGASSSTPVALTYPSIPEGGEIQAQFCVYSENHTLLGHWTSAWVPALRPQPEAVLGLSGAIQETLIPLTADTIYNYKEKLIFDSAAATHRWQPNQFAVDAGVISMLDQSEIPQTLQTAFQQNAFALSAAAQVIVVTAGAAWHIADGNSVFILNFNAKNNEVVVNTSNVPLEVLPLDKNDVGNNLGAIVDLTMNNRAYMIGYCWMASGQDVCAARTAAPVITSQINTFQNINVLANPEASLKFSGVGFTNQPFIVYDQFGPVPLFSVDSSFTTDLDAGTITAELAALFTGNQYPLPTDGVAVQAVTASVEWTIVVASIPTYSLLAGGGQINVYPYPAVIISANNFYLEPMSGDPDNYTYQVRKVSLDDSTPFDMEQTQSWGQFLLPHLSDVVVHPQGFLVGTHANLDKLEILKLPAQAVADVDAQPAVYVGGTGTRPGLFSGPVALTVAADGRILVLEQGNGRIQAIDISGNPVPCFTNASVAGVPSSCAADLDRRLVSQDLRSAFTAAGQALSPVWRIQDGRNIYNLATTESEVSVTSGSSLLHRSWTLTDSGDPPQAFQLALSSDAISVARDGSPLFATDPSVSAALDGGAAGPILTSAFAANGITLSYPLAVLGTSPLSLKLATVQDLVQGTIPASLTAGLAERNIILTAAAAVTADVTVTILQLGVHWTLCDAGNGSTFDIKVSPEAQTLTVARLLPTMLLNPPPAGQTMTYLSVASEAKGYIYVLSYANLGTDIADFVLDIYQPDGAWLTSTPAVNVGDTVVDMWRNLYTLNYESFLGPNGRTEPSISVWTPST